MLKKKDMNKIFTKDFERGLKEDREGWVPGVRSVCVGGSEGGGERGEGC